MTALTEDDEGVVIRKLAVPMAFGIVFMIALNLVDTYFVGRLGTEELAAMSFTFPVVSLVISLAMGLGIGSTSAISRAIGNDHEKDVQRLATHALYLAGLVVAFVSVIGVLTQGPVFRALGATEEVLPLLREYMTIWFLGAVFLVVPMVGLGALRAQGDTRTPMFVMMAAATTNIILDPILIFGFGPVPALGLRGAALATIAARSVTLVVSLYVLFKRELLDLHVPTRAELFDSWKRILSVGLPAAITNILAPVATAILTGLIARSGPEAVAAYGVGSRMEGLVLIAPMAVSASLTPFVGQNWGAHREDRVARGLKIVRRFVIIWGLVAWVVLALTGRYVGRVFTDDPAVLEILEVFFIIVPASYAANGVVSVASAAFNAVDRAVRSTLLSAARSLVFAVPLASLGLVLGGNTGIFVGITVAAILAGGAAVLWMRDLVNVPDREGALPGDHELDGYDPTVVSLVGALRKRCPHLVIHADRKTALSLYEEEREIGHIHRDGRVHLHVPPGIHDALIADGWARHHDSQVDTSWVALSLSAPEEQQRAFELISAVDQVFSIRHLEPEARNRELDAIGLPDNVLAATKALWSSAA